MRGATVGDALTSLVARAHAKGFADVVLVSAGLDQLDPEAVRASGVDAVRAVSFSHVPTVHDRLAGREGALVGALVTMRALHRLGVAIELEAPLLPPNLADPRALVDLATRAVGTLRSVRFFVPSAPVPTSVAPPSFDRIRDALAEAVEGATRAGASVRFDASQGIPPCAFGERESMHGLFVLGRSRKKRPDLDLLEICRSCALRQSCPGPTAAYLEANGTGGLRAFERRPEALHGGRRSARPRVTEREREASRHVQFVVLRPTVHCNQDCLFCSANESSGNAFTDPKRMLTAIARVAQRGVKRISFSGGEPTLSPNLVHYVDAARRCGVREIEIVTNGVLLDREPKVRRLVDAGLTHAFVSLHAPDEALSRTLTQKDGDHARTLRAIELLADAGVAVGVNHVVVARNQAHLPAFVEMVRERFGGRVLLSIAFMTPQYKALEHADLWPRLSDTRPYLLRALQRSIELGQPIVVGSRQGVPPCQLGPYAPWSDVLDIAAEAASEDAPQKVQGPGCARCRYRLTCQGVWRPYAERFGTDELVPIEGEPFTEKERRAIGRHYRFPPFGQPGSFEEACELLRDREAERAPLPELPRTKIALSVHRPKRTRALRALWIGSGRRARELAEAASRLSSLLLTGVASPHAPDAPGWGSVPRFRDARVALAETRPEVAVIAAATEAHVDLALACLEAGVPVLLEKPVARSVADALALVSAIGFVSCASQELFLPGLDGLGETGGELTLSSRMPKEAPDAPRAWDRRPLAAMLHHVMSLAVRARGPLTEVGRVQFEGAGRPTRLRAQLVHERGAVDLRLDFVSSSRELSLLADGFEWRTDGRAVRRNALVLERDGSDAERMLRAFVGAVLRGEAPPVPLAEGIETLRATEALVAAFAAAGAPLERAGAPKHVTSPRYRVPSRGTGRDV